MEPLWWHGDGGLRRPMALRPREAVRGLGPDRPGRKGPRRGARHPRRDRAPRRRAPVLMEEARLERTEYGLGPASEGWFVVNVRDAEWNQEDFLVLGGECVLLIEGEERRLKPWDFVHCPPGTEHVFVGAGDGPCVIFMTGARTAEKSIVYPRSELALRHGAGVDEETTSPNEAYATLPKWQPGRKGPWSLRRDGPREGDDDDRVEES